MTKNYNEEACLSCEYYNKFKVLLAKNDYTLEEAFHEIFAEFSVEIIDSVIEVAGEDSYNEGYNDGIIYGIQSVAHNALKVSEDLRNQMNDEECVCCSYDENECCSECPDEDY